MREHPPCIVLVIPGRLAGLNEHDKHNRTSAHAGAEHKKRQQERIGWAILSQHMQRIPNEWYPLSVTFRWYEQNHKRDPDNIAFAKKYILDALQDMRRIQGDGWRYIAALKDEFYVDEAQPRIEIIIQEGQKGESA